MEVMELEMICLPFYMCISRVLTYVGLMWERTFPMALSPHPCFEFVPVVSSTHAYPSMEPESTKTCSTWRYLQLGLDVVLISKEFLTNMGIRQFRGVSSLFSL